MERSGAGAASEAIGDVPSAARSEWVWAVVRQEWDGEVVFVALRRATCEHWRKRLPVLWCRGWGELRSELSAEVYAEVRGLAGHRGFEEYTRNLAVTGCAPVVEAYDLASARYDATSVPPADDVPFSAYDDIGACADGYWPPAVAYLVNEDVPEDILARHAERSWTAFNGRHATIPARARVAVLAELAAMGFELSEEPKLGKLVNARF